MTGISGNLLSCIKGVKLPFKFREGTWDCYLGNAGERPNFALKGESRVFLWTCGLKLGVQKQPKRPRKEHVAYMYDGTLLGHKKNEIMPFVAT